jgi:hypothetical protein
MVKMEAATFCKTLVSNHHRISHKHPEYHELNLLTVVINLLFWNTFNRVLSDNASYLELGAENQFCSTFIPVHAVIYCTSS